MADLTERQRRIVELIRQGKTNMQIAAAIQRSHKSTARDVAEIVALLGVQTRRALIANEYRRRTCRLCRALVVGDAYDARTKTCLPCRARVDANPRQSHDPERDRRNREVREQVLSVFEPIPGRAWAPEAQAWLMRPAARMEPEEAEA